MFVKNKYQAQQVDKFKTSNVDVQVLNLRNEIKPLLPRNLMAHKGDFGHVLVIGGDYGMAGAVRIAAEAAARVGAGLVTIATRPEHAVLINAIRPEIMTDGVSTKRQLRPLLDKATMVVIGPGLGRSSWSKGMFQAALDAEKPMVVDADGLNILAVNQECRNNWILTPHPGEAARLLATTIKNIQTDRPEMASKIQNIFGGICVLKGAGTLIAAYGEKTRLCNAGNPGMASGGMGDVLSGIIGGLVAQGLSLFDAAKLGVLAHAMAGDLVAAKYGKLGILALDLLPEVRKILNAKLN